VWTMARMAVVPRKLPLNSGGVEGLQWVVKRLSLSFPFGAQRTAFNVTEITRDVESSRTGFANTFSSTVDRRSSQACGSRSI
jgi:hypothetical protein